MVPLSSLRIPRARRYSGFCRAALPFTYMILTFSDRPSHAVRLDSSVTCAVLTPGVFLLPVWPLPLSLAATYGISFDFSSSAYLDVSVRRVPLTLLCIHKVIHNSSLCGFPHSDIHGSMHICCSPWLFAACHVLLRLLMPRHSPCALLSLNLLLLVLSLSLA